jgi:hypothetical protein
MINNGINVHNYVVGDGYLRGDLDVSKLPTIALEKGDDTIIVATYEPTFIKITYLDKIQETNNIIKNQSHGGSNRRKRRKSKKRKSSSRQS